MATTFTFPKAPRVGDRIEIVATSESKLPITLVGNSEAGKTLELVFPDITYSGAADGATTITTISDLNTVLTFKCVAAQYKHVWVLEGSYLYSYIAALQTQLTALTQRVAALEEVVDL